MMMKWGTLLLLASSVIAMAGLSQSALSFQVPIQDFSQVSSFLYRGARPTPEGLQALAAMQIKTDLDIEDDLDAIKTESVLARRLGIQFVSVPLSGFFEPSDADMAKIFQVIQNPVNYPIYLHCKHGHDRTGLVVGLYRVFDEGWTPQQAYSEMLAHGFHPLLLGLNHYFKEKTELNLAEELQ
jgi:protein tyrosine/serine phosphatase